MLTESQLASIIAEVAALIAALAFFIRSMAKVWENRSKIDTLRTQIEQEREQADVKTRQIINDMFAQNTIEMQALRKEVTDLKMDNARYQERESLANQRMTDMQGRIDGLVYQVAELRINLNHAELATREQRDAYEKRLAEKEAELARITELYHACLEATEGVSG